MSHTTSPTRDGPLNFYDQVKPGICTKAGQSMKQSNTQRLYLMQCYIQCHTVNYLIWSQLLNYFHKYSNERKKFITDHIASVAMLRCWSWTNLNQHLLIYNYTHTITHTVTHILRETLHIHRHTFCFKKSRHWWFNSSTNSLSKSWSEYQAPPVSDTWGVTSYNM